MGTTDNDYSGDIAHVQPGGDDIDYILEAANSFFGLDLGRGDLTGAYAGVRPLISTGDPRKSVDISRKAELYETSSGMLTITGGKLTTWRRMAKQVVDRMVEREGRVAPCRTDDIPLGMAASDHELDPPDGRRRGRAPGGLPRAARLPLRARGPQRPPRSPASGPSSRRPSSPADRTCSPRRWSPRASSRRCRSPTCSCAGPGWPCSRRPQLRTAEAVAPVARGDRRGAGLGRGAGRGRGGALGRRRRRGGDRSGDYPGW